MALEWAKGRHLRHTHNFRVLSSIMLSLSRHTPKRGTTCQRCLIIRYFILVMFGLALLAVIADDGMHYLGSATPMHAALVIMAVGMAGFLAKVVMWKLQTRAAVSSDPAPASPQEASREENAQTPSH